MTTTPTAKKRGRPETYSTESSDWAVFHSMFRGYHFRNIHTGAIVTKLSMYYKLRAKGKLADILLGVEYLPEHHQLVDVPGWRKGHLINDNKTPIQ